MILTITLNPSVDISYPLEKFIIDGVNRVDGVKKTAGGKGLNVTRVAHLSGHPVVATGFLGGTIGSYLQQQLDEDKIKHDFCIIGAESRNCIAILHEGYQTEILESGPVITQEEQVAFKEHFTSLLKDADIITISGSLPKGISDSYYAELIEIANCQKKKVLLDASGTYLQAAITHGNSPYLIKPNHEELGQLVGKKLDASDLNGLVDAIKSETSFMQIPLVVVSLGKEGALVKYEESFYKVSIPSIRVVNPVGAGDSTLAGLAIGVLQKESMEKTLRRAMTFGMLNTMEAQTGYINMAHYDDLFTQVSITQIK